MLCLLLGIYLPILNYKSIIVMRNLLFISVLIFNSICTLSAKSSPDGIQAVVCAADAIASTLPTSCSRSVILDGPTSDDPNCDITILSYTIDGVLGIGTVVSQEFDAGIYEIIYSVEDCNSTPSTCTQQLTILDSTSPQMGCLQAETVYCSINMIPTVSNLDDFILAGGSASDNCMLDSASFNFVSDVATYTSMGGDTIIYERTYAISDTAGALASCGYLITVLTQDTFSITCPIDILENTDHDSCSAYLSIASPSILSCQSYVLTHNSTFADNPGDDATGTYPTGTTTIEWLLVGDDGRRDSCEQIIIVHDNQTPYLTCPLPSMAVCVLADNPPYTSYASFENAILLSNSVIYDNCGIDTNTFELVSVVMLPGTPPEERRTYRIGDFSNPANFAQCFQDVMVMDMEMPEITVPNDTTVMNIPNTCSADVVLNLATATDDCGIDTIYNNITNNADASGSFPVGMTCIYWVVIDINGNIEMDTTCVTVLDTMSPIITCPSGFSVVCDVSSAPAYADLDEFLAAGGTASDVCGLDSSYFEVTVLDSINNIVRREYSVQDSAGNISSCIQSITITDTEDPVLFCPSDVNLQCLADLPVASSSLAEFLVINGDATDNCGLNDDSFSFVSDVSDGNKCPETITRTYQIEDTFGNATMCSYDFIINDTTGPTITCNGDVDAVNGIDSCSAYVSIITPTALTDNCGIQSITNDYNNSDNASDVYPVGATTVIWTLTDSCGNSDTCSIIVTVTDEQFPELTCPNTASAQCESSEVPVYATFAELLADGGSVIENCTIDESSFSVDADLLIGTGTCIDSFSRVYYISDESGNTISCSQLIIVEDTTNPTFTVPADITIGCNDSTDPATTGNVTNIDDNCGLGNMVPSYTDVIVNGSCPTNMIITRTWVLLDDCDNETSIAQVITIADTDVPDVIVQDVTVYLDATGSASIEATDIDNGSSDDCGLDVILSLDITEFDCDDLTSSPITVELTVTDSCGNSDSLEALVTVLDTIAPIATSPITVITDCNLDDVPPFENIQAFLDAGGLIDENCVAFGITLLSANSDLQSCPETITRTYVINDIGNNTDTVTHTIIINDEEAPVITCPADIVMSNDEGLCSATVDFGQATATDNCTILNFSEDKIGNEFTVGSHTVRWIVTDGCNNSDTCYQSIIVEDTEAPVLTINNDLVVNLTNTGIVTLDTDVFVTAFSDNCEMDSISIRRMDDNCDIPENLLEGQEVNFCCADVSTGPHNVIITAWDIYGNSSQYMSSITIQDKLPPVIVSCPTDVTVDCDYAIDLNDLSEFGKLVTENGQIEDIIINGQIVGQDGLINENCPDQIQITETVIEGIHCGQGVIERTFHVTDASGIEVTCTQNIFVVDTDPFVEADITWPTDTTLETSIGFCNPTEFDPDVYGRPEYITDNCSLVGQTKSDEIVYYPSTGCKLIIRTWKVIDWCQYETNSSYTPQGIWEYEQRILLTNSVAPVITSTCSDTILCSDINTCAGNNFNLTINATDDCTEASALFYSYKIDLHNDGSNNLNGNGQFANHYFINGTHKISWSVNDRCGNITSCEYLFTVQDCKAPTPVCFHGLTANLVNEGVVELWASDFNQESYDNCTEMDDLKLSFSSDPDDFGRTYTCDDIGEQRVELWVTDEEGNQSYCVTYVVIQDNLNICPEQPQMINIAGTITTNENVSINEVDVNLTATEMNLSKDSDDEGHFMFEELPSDYDYHLEVKKDGNDLFGISTLDIILIQRHILHLKRFDNPYDILAADVNNSGKISTADLVELRKLILGKIDAFTKIDSWRFVNRAFEFDDVENPWNCEESIDYNNVSNDMMNSDFVAIKVGDVNGTASDLWSGNTNQYRNSYTISYENKSAKAGSRIRVPFYGNEGSITGFQMALGIDLELLKFESIQQADLDINNHNIRVIDNNINISWSSTEAIDVNGKVLFYVDFIAKKDMNIKDGIQIDDRGIRTELYDQALSVHTINLREKLDDALMYKLYEAAPNPFNEMTSIRVDLPKETSITLKIRDNQGKLIYTNEMLGKKGGNIFNVNNTELRGVTGVLYYTIGTSEFTKTKKMIKIN